VKDWLSRLLRGRGTRAGQDQRSPKRIAAILEKSDPPEAHDRALFDDLQSGPPPPLVYDYDAFSTWRRGVERAISIVERTRVDVPGKRVLEVASGDGMTGAAMASFGHEVVLLDMEDWRDARAKALAFKTHDLAGPLAYPDDSFDLVFSYNAFEHIPDPEFVLQEISRITCPGGAIYLDFDPLYASAWGLHAWRTLRMPYPQFLFAEDLLTERLKELGMYDLGRKMLSLQPLNRWRVEQFRDLWRRSGCTVELLHEPRDERFIEIVERYPTAFQGRGLTVDDLTIHGIQVLLRKPSNAIP
jgi:SAM-dependent methyltransferase